MPKPAEAVAPILAALLSTGASVLAFAMLRAGGAGADVSLLSSMILAGMLNIRQLALLNCESRLPTSQTTVGELSS